MTTHHRLHRHALGAAGLTTLAALTGALAATPATGADGASTITIKDYAYTAPHHPLTVGDSLTWTNQDKAPHDAATTKAPVAFKSPILKTGESWTYTFTEPGTYDYYCSLHPRMIATLEVTAAASDEADSQAPVTPEEATKKPAPRPAEERTKAVESTSRSRPVDEKAAPAEDAKAAVAPQDTERTAATRKETSKAITEKPRRKEGRPAAESGAGKGATEAKKGTASKPAAKADAGSSPARARSTAAAAPVSSPAPGGSAPALQTMPAAAPASSSTDGVNGLTPTLTFGGIVVAIIVVVLLVAGSRRRSA